MKKRTAILLVVASVLVTAVLSFFTAWFVFPRNKDATPLLGGLNEVYRYLDSYYYKDLDESALNLGILRGVVDALGDPYSDYLTNEEYAQLQETESGKYSGIGVTVEIDAETGYPRASIVHKGAPAESAGVQVGDIFTAIDGVPIDTSLSLTQIAMELRGEADTTVTITVYRDGTSLDIAIVRKNVTIHRVEYRMLPNDIAHITITEFNGDCLEEFQKALTYVQEQKAKAIVLDLRNNPGGYLNYAVSIADAFLDRGVVVTVREKSGKEDVYNSEAGALDLPMVVLMNSSSASASEVLAGALQDRSVAKVVGVDSFGKALVQRYYPLADSDGWIKITIASYFTPNGNDISGTGIKPDYQVELDEEQVKRPSTLTDENDTQLKKAVELLKEEIQ
ncbi:S41 family peptidase [Eubacteriales bacterium OttesenSCG-928-M02]|nr:S41 family peptidase [Eubacteriales bacterium OttesenSCG-928-M02]